MEPVRSVEPIYWQRACHECDLLLSGDPAPPGRALVCPRCHCTLQRGTNRGIYPTIALSLTGLLLFVPSASLPLLTFSLFSLGAENTLLNGVDALYQGGFMWLSALVLFCSVLAPLAKFLLLLFLCCGSAWGLLDRPVANAVRWYQHIKDWGMLDVYMLGLLVALVKLRDLGQLEVEPGLYCFGAMMLVANLASLSFDQNAIWQRLAQRRAARGAGR
ncbi:paraquat-inducible protein A [Microbulbifer spongiae]|uniref:Paraquat-inducible protein A n=1 Tax=Microbulbifer spongiae TaxID=2944933 RepID=A0ABY9EBG3_9GAMM|nr:paraquat-inducible protein A [Microbulbifer sp. MI-G]WKD49291.1 paraquat-inducible protein A [Microbulbifer sp. MI-G]